MKTLLRSTVVNAVALSLTAQILMGLQVSGGYITMLYGGLVLMILGLILKPVLSLVALPLNLVTFGFASFLVNIVILYVLTLIIPQIAISEFLFKGYSFGGFVIPKFFFNTFFAYAIIGSVFSAISAFIYWIFE